MTDSGSTAEFSDSLFSIPFVYRDIGADRDIPCVYWNNRYWSQVMYDAFRERWSDSYPIFFGAHEAITTRFGFDSAVYTPEELAYSFPDTLRAEGGRETGSGTIYLEKVVSFCRWYDIETKTEYLAERFSSGEWRLASFDKASFQWDMESEPLTEAAIRSRYMADYPCITLLGGLPPSNPG